MKLLKKGNKLLSDDNKLLVSVVDFPDLKPGEAESSVVMDVPESEGSYPNRATGARSMAIGNGTIAKEKNQLVIGTFNEDEENALFIVGNGNNTNDRSNALEVLSDGRVKSYGIPTEDNDLTPKKYVDESNIEQDQRIDSNYRDINQTIAKLAKVESIAKGAHRAISFASYQEMQNTFNNEQGETDRSPLKVGQSIYIGTLNVPDLWVSEVTSFNGWEYVSDDVIIQELKEYGNIHIGYYVLSVLETQKVDLTNYLQKSNEAYKVYTTNVNGNQQLLNYDVFPSSNSLVLRSTSGSSTFKELRILEGGLGFITGNDENGNQIINWLDNYWLDTLKNNTVKMQGNQIIYGDLDVSNLGIGVNRGIAFHREGMDDIWLTHREVEKIYNMSESGGSGGADLEGIRNDINNTNSRLDTIETNLSNNSYGYSRNNNVYDISYLINTLNNTYLIEGMNDNPNFTYGQIILINNRECPPLWVWFWNSDHVNYTYTNDDDFIAEVKNFGVVTIGNFCLSSVIPNGIISDNVSPQPGAENKIFYFSTYEELINTLNAITNPDDANVPIPPYRDDQYIHISWSSLGAIDLWTSGGSSEYIPYQYTSDEQFINDLQRSNVQIGYYLVRPVRAVSNVNLNNYYNKSEVDNAIANAITKVLNEEV